MSAPYQRWEVSGRTAIIRAGCSPILRNIRINQSRQDTAPEIGVSENAENVFVETSPDPYALYVGKVDRERVREAIRQLSMGQREILRRWRCYDASRRVGAAIRMGCRD